MIHNTCILHKGQRMGRGGSMIGTTTYKLGKRERDSIPPKNQLILAPLHWVVESAILRQPQRPYCKIQILQ